MYYSKPVRQQQRETMEPKSTITVRVPASVRDRLEALAKEQRKKTGDPVPVSDLVREALEDYLKRREA
jgi:predicted DNA-binding protein